MRSPRVFIHRYISWVLVAVSVSTIITGYTLSRGLLPDFVIVSYLHRVSELLFIGLIVAHIAYTLVHFKLSLRKTAGKIGLYQKNSIYFMRLAQRISSWVIVFAAMGMILTGLNGYAFFAQSVEDIIPFAPHRIFDVLLVSAIIVHVVIGVRFALMRRRVRAKVARRFTMFLTVSLLLVAFSLNIPTSTLETPQDPDDRPLDSQINVDLTRYSFNSADVQTVRPDIFLPGSFSMFDVLVHLDFLGKVELEYHFNESMNTHVIDSLNGEPTWWYQVIYSGGWIERNVYRMDHYVWKPETSLKFIRINKDRLDTIYRSYAEEVARTESGGGQLVIPTVTINGHYRHLEFTNVVVTAHNLRNETFQPGILTGIDVIMSLGDQGLINYTLQWYDSIGSASVVMNYWVESINDDEAVGTCGFVYDTGSLEYYGFLGNHIHLPSDVNVLNSPEYMRWFWICI